MKRVLSFLPSIVLFAILMIMSGIGTLIQFGFDFQAVAWTALAISFALRLMTSSMSKYIGADTCYNIEKNKPQVAEPRNKFTVLSRAIDYGNFEKWIDEENLETKKGLYKERMLKKINKVNRKIRSIEIKNKYKKHNRFERAIEGLQANKQALENENTAEYIADNIAFMRIVFKPLKAKDFETDSEIVNKSQKTYSMNTQVETVKGIIKGMPLMLFTTLLGSMMTYNITIGSINALSLCYDIAMVLWYGIMGIGIGKKNIQRLIGVYNDRSAAISTYINTAGGERSKAFKLLEALQEKT